MIQDPSNSGSASICPRLRSSRDSAWFHGHGRVEQPILGAYLAASAIGCAGRPAGPDGRRNAPWPGHGNRRFEKNAQEQASSTDWAHFNARSTSSATLSAGTHGTMMDMYRSPDKLLKATTADPVAAEVGSGRPRILGQPHRFMPRQGRGRLHVRRAVQKVLQAEPEGR